MRELLEITVINGGLKKNKKKKMKKNNENIVYGSEWLEDELVKDFSL